MSSGTCSVASRRATGLRKRANGEAVLKQGRRTEHIRLIELPDAARGPVMRAFPTKVPRGVSFFLKTGAVDAPTPEALEKGAAKAPSIASCRADRPRLRIKTLGVPQAAPQKGRHHRSPALNPSHGRLLERDTDEADSRVKEGPVRRLLLARAGSERIRDSEPQVSAPRLASREVPSGPWRIDRESVSSN